MEIHRKYKFMQYFLYSKDLSREEIMQKGKILVVDDEWKMRNIVRICIGSIFKVHHKQYISI